MRLVRNDAADFRSLWEALWRADDWRHPLHQPRNRDYYLEYFRASRFSDASVVVANGTLPVAGLVMAVRHGEDGAVDLAAHGQPLHLLEVSSSPPAARRAAARLMVEEVDRLIAQHSVANVTFQDFLRDGCLSDVGEALLERGARANPFFTCVIDLSPTEADLRTAVSRRTKGHINWGEKHLDLLLLERENVTPEHLEAFRRLHVEVAGRETRSAGSWAMQYEMVRGDEAFAILASLEGRLVSASLFCRSDRTCYYGVGATRRELFDRSISHVLMWRAIQHSKRLGLRWFEVGERLFPEVGLRRPDEKELGISRFKGSFGGGTRVRLDLRLEQAAARAASKRSKEES